MVAPAKRAAGTHKDQAEEIVLRGMEEICAVAKRSEPTVLRWIREKDFPAVKEDGIWISDRIRIKAWYRERIETRGARR